MMQIFISPVLSHPITWKWSSREIFCIKRGRLWMTRLTSSGSFCWFQTDVPLLYLYPLIVYLHYESFAKNPFKNVIIGRPWIHPNVSIEKPYAYQSNSGTLSPSHPCILKWMFSWLHWSVGFKWGLFTNIYEAFSPSTPKMHKAFN